MEQQTAAANERLETMDRIYLPAMHFVAVHGAYEAEHYEPQLFGVSLEICCDTFRAGETDCLDDAVDYSGYYDKINEIMQGAHCDLLEHLAAKIAKAVLADSRVKQATVQVEKTAADMGGTKVPVAVKITRRAADYGC